MNPDLRGPSDRWSQTSIYTPGPPFIQVCVVLRTAGQKLPYRISPGQSAYRALRGPSDRWTEICLFTNDPPSGAWNAGSGPSDRQTTCVQSLSGPSDLQTTSCFFFQSIAKRALRAVLRPGSACACREHVVQHILIMFKICLEIFGNLSIGFPLASFCERAIFEWSFGPPDNVRFFSRE